MTRNMLHTAKTFCIAVMLFSASPCSAATLVVAPEEAGREAHVVNKGIQWQTSLQSASEIASKEGKLIFWIHMLGTMEGAT